MKRRDFVSLLGSVPLAAIPGRGLFEGAASPGPVSVETPADRRDYTRKLLNALCDRIGPRPTGSPGYARGAQIIKGEMERSLPEVHFDRYELARWELLGEPEFNMGGQRIETCPSFGGEGTPPDGLRGILQDDGDGFVLADPGTGDPLAGIWSNRYGKAITRHQGRTDPPSLPSFGIGRQDLPLVERAVRRQIPTRLKAWVRLVPNAPGMNVVGRLPGRRREEILFIAHADTVYNSPGANDNTASVIVMLMLAHAAARRRPEHTLTFVAADSEEYGQLGAEHYAGRRLADGTMKNIRYVVNFDSLTWGPDMWISSHQQEMKELIGSIHRDLNLDTDPRMADSDGFVMDSAPFRPSGARAMHINSRGYNEKTLPVYHRPEDTAMQVPLDCTENGFRVFDEFIRRVDQG